ncbi:hypothetical protein CK203_104947 [Vitis vinifera]|uniref:Uncharacterized protein n=1 Tax=Vitis vinifera TaxID=29760 RepID=A0A438CQZ4_VITVI|nr:hypothetical protein CK203_104947 [Vitis vinifera]
MDPPQYFYVANVREFFSTLKDWRRGYRKLHFSIRRRADIISTETIVAAFGLPSFTHPEAQFAPQSRPVFFRIARILAPWGTHYRSAITRLEMPHTLWRMVESSLTHHGYHHLFFSKESPLPPTPTFDTRFPVFPIPLPPPLSSALEPAIPISTPVVSELFVSMDSHIDARLNSEGQVDGEIFICATDTGVDIIIRDDPPMVQDVGKVITLIMEITDQATTPMLEEIDGVVDPINGA